MHKTYAYKSAFSVIQRQMCYLRMRQRLSEASETYTHLKNLIMSEILLSDSEPAMFNVMLKKAMFEHFVNDDVSEANTFKTLVRFLHNHYFSQISWGKLFLNSKKCQFFVDRFKILSHVWDAADIKLSENKIDVFRNYSVSTDKNSFLWFINQLLWLAQFISDWANIIMILKKALIEKILKYEIQEKKQKIKTVIDFYWESEQQKVFDLIKNVICENSCSDEDLKKQYHLTTDALKTDTDRVLYQLNDLSADTVMTSNHMNKLWIIMFMSYQFTQLQTQYHIMKREALASLKSLKELQWLVKDSAYSVKLYTDHQTLLKTLKSEDLTEQIARW